jgi:hypothetical protein
LKKLINAFNILRISHLGNLTQWVVAIIFFLLFPVVSGFDGGGLSVEAVVGQWPHLVGVAVATVEADRFSAVVVINDVAATLESIRFNEFFFTMTETYWKYHILLLLSE